MPSPTRRQPPTRTRIEDPAPVVDCGRYAPKRTVGDLVEVGADIIRDGHDVLAAVVRWKGPGETRWQEAPMVAVDAHHAGVRWAGSFPVTRPGRWVWNIQAWSDQFASWREELSRKVDAGQDDLTGELSEGAVLLEAISARAGQARGGKADRARIEEARVIVADPEAPTRHRAGAALAEDLAEVCSRQPDRSRAAVMDQEQAIDVDRPLARFGSWYEVFPRSWGGLEGVRKAVPRLAELGFDVLYLPPIHPIGRTNRKGRNNALVAGPSDPGSPYAIGGPEGGHTALHPDLGTVDDFDALVADAKTHGMEIALDYAINCSADHPWLTEHPEWFNRRPDGTLKYAENPPKKYQDIYNLNFDSDDWRSLWQALLDVLLVWIDRGVTVFRVDNPHTKPVPFWEWLIAEVRRDHPDVVFLAEAFTRRAMMQTLAKIGFSQSYTYFTWKSSLWELTEYVTELATSGEQEYFRPNFFVNTPDILTEELQLGGPAKFTSRLVLAATLSPSYGVYSGFEHFERTPVRPGSEEYLDSEKYQLRARRLDGPLLPLIATLNRIRREQPALQYLDNVRFLDTGTDALIAYAKGTGVDTVVCVVLLDPIWPQEGAVVVPDDLDLPPSFDVIDQLTGDRWHWHLGPNYVRLEPGEHPAHILVLA